MVNGSALASWSLLPPLCFKVDPYLPSYSFYYDRTISLEARRLTFIILDAVFLLSSTYTSMLTPLARLRQYSEFATFKWAVFAALTTWPI